MTDGLQTDGAERARLWDTERNLRGWGYVFVIGGLMYGLGGLGFAGLSALGAAAGGSEEGGAAGALGLIFGAGLAGWGLLFAGLGYMLSVLEPQVRWFAAGAALLSFLIGPCGFVSLFPLVLLVGSASGEVLSPLHGALRERTAAQEAELRRTRGGDLKPLMIAGSVFAVFGVIGLLMSVLVGGAFYQYSRIEDQILNQPLDEGGDWEEE